MSTGRKSGNVEGHGQDQLATMEMQVLNERQKAELANVRYVDVWSANCSTNSYICTYIV